MIVKLVKFLLLKPNTILRTFSSSSKPFTMSAEINIGVPLKKVISELEAFAPKNLAESWDNTGLLVEPYTPR
jgi:hypothetical protein